LGYARRRVDVNARRLRFLTAHLKRCQAEAYERDAKSAGHTRPSLHSKHTVDQAVMLGKHTFYLPS
jgi:hypothetical protein